MNRHEYRVQIIFALYQHLLLKKELALCFNSSIIENDDEYLHIIVSDLEINIDKYINEINPLLNRWTFERLSYIDQAILLEAYSEFYTKTNNKNIIIDEAIRIAKEYSDEQSYKYINGVLDNL